MPLPFQPLLLCFTSIGQLYKSGCVRAIEKTISITISSTITTATTSTRNKSSLNKQTHINYSTISTTPLSNTISPTSDKMRPSTVFSVLAVAVYSSPLPRQNDPLSNLLGLAGLNSLTGSLGLGGLTGSLNNVPLLTPLGGLTDTLFNTVGQLLSLPLGLLSPILVPSTVPCGLDAGFCVNTCSAECTGSSKKCSDCLLTCYKQSCANGQCNGTTPNAPNHVVADSATE
ncbi:hypothetical protein EV127DRAFT_435450 [Xylaria flabelliformis]|nr:hypothetical protein EV127DRAFT_435450 [Xylaria flabelliformis]